MRERLTAVITITRCACAAARGRNRRRAGQPGPPRGSCGSTAPSGTYRPRQRPQQQHLRSQHARPSRRNDTDCQDHSLAAVLWKHDLLPGPVHVTVWARRNWHHGADLTRLATASRWDTDPHATAAVARSIYGHFPTGGAPLWLGFKNVGTADPAAALAALA